jgi:hypothetical protein
MDDAPEKMWVFPKADWFNAGASNVRLSSAGANDVEYTRSDIADGLRDSVVSRNDLLAELARNVEGRQERIDTLEAEVARLREALEDIAQFKFYDGFSTPEAGRASAALEYKD